ncbi:MAG: TorF family putative porin [Ectothiorhodospira sp.]
MHTPMNRPLLAGAVATALVAVAAVPSTAAAEVSANIGFTSNYLFRGVTQTDDQAAVQGGVDYAHDEGFYVGTWASNVDYGADSRGYELDGYFGLASDIGDSGVGFDVGYIYYAYPSLDDSDMGEVYGGLDFMGAHAMVNLVTNADADGMEDTVSYELGYGLDLTGDMSLDGTVGYVDPDEGDDDYTWWSVGLTRATELGDFTLAYTQNDIDDEEDDNADDPRVSVAFNMSF